MPETVPRIEAEFVYRRTTGSFAGFVSDVLSAFSPWWLFAGLALALVAYYVLKAVGIRFRSTWRKPVMWVVCLSALGLFIYNLIAVESGKGSAEIGIGSDLFSVGNKIAWYVFVSLVLVYSIPI